MTVNVIDWSYVQENTDIHLLYLYMTVNGDSKSRIKTNKGSL